MRGCTRWVAATVGSNNASGYQLATGEPVMADRRLQRQRPVADPRQFQQLVSEGKIHYFIGGGGFGVHGGSTPRSEIAAWVAANFTAQTVGGSTVYDLTAPSTGGTTARRWGDHGALTPSGSVGSRPRPRRVSL